eukprot:3695424-Amphidinium_carterae.1
MQLSHRLNLKYFLQHDTPSDNTAATSDMPAPMSVTSSIPSTKSFDSLDGPKKVLCMQDPTFMASGRACSTLFLNKAMFRPCNLYAPAWTGEVLRHVQVHELSNFKVDGDGKSIYWTHSTMTKLVKIANSETKAWGRRFIFTSGLQYLLHRCFHQHYGLSDVTLTSDTVALAFEASDAWIPEVSNRAQNGCATNWSTSELTLNNVVIKGLVTLDGESILGVISSDKWREEFTQ